jgi:hypothetical protein
MRTSASTRPGSPAPRSGKPVRLESSIGDSLPAVWADRAGLIGCDHHLRAVAGVELADDPADVGLCGCRLTTLVPYLNPYRLCLMCLMCLLDALGVRG